jgi:hypothetical protein
MASVLTSQPGEINPPGPASRSAQAMPPLAEVLSSDNVKQEPEHERGRPRSGSDDKDVDGLDLDDGDDGDGGDGAHSSNSDGPARKRRRSRKGLDKKFECPEKGCGKSYSRAEHLYVPASNRPWSRLLTQCKLPPPAEPQPKASLQVRHWRLPEDLCPTGPV